MKYHKFTIKHQNNVSINEIATYYARRIKSENIKTLYFHPLKKSPLATSNEFRLATLKYLTVNSCYRAISDKHALEIVTEAAIDAGYIIKEVSADDYDRKLYMPVIKAELQQCFSFAA